MIIIMTIVATLALEGIVYIIYRLLKERQTEKIREKLPSYMRYYP